MSYMYIKTCQQHLLHLSIGKSSVSSSKVCPTCIFKPVNSICYTYLKVNPLCLLQRYVLHVYLNLSTASLISNCLILAENIIFDFDLHENYFCLSRIHFQSQINFLFNKTGISYYFVRPSLKIFQFAQTRPMTFGYG